MELHVPNVTTVDLEAFHRAHFGNSLSITSAGADNNLVAIGQEEEDDDLGYYPDGVKRTLTDEQITMFRNSEIYSILRKRQLQRENQEGHEDFNPVTEAVDLPLDSLDHCPEERVRKAIASHQAADKQETRSNPAKRQKRNLGRENCWHEEEAASSSSRREIRELDNTSADVDYLDYGEAPSVGQLDAGTTPSEQQSAARTKPDDAHDGAPVHSHHLSEPEDDAVPKKQGKKIWWPTLG
ncbi:MAG: hypothetical protein LQ341_002805 [Variospora aurantia]|nr:MAG: hypothetical protein LQ341_002805 [Variospora aurantia]